MQSATNKAGKKNRDMLLFQESNHASQYYIKKTLLAPPGVGKVG